MTVLLFTASMVLCAIDWRLGGMFGARYGNRYITAALVTWVCWPILFPVFGWWSLLYVVWFGVGEHSGWAPKFAKEGGWWWGTALRGMAMGGVGFIIVPLSTWIHRRIRFDPPRYWPQWACHFFEYKAQNELWAGALSPTIALFIFSLIGVIIQSIHQ